MSSQRTSTMACSLITTLLLGFSWPSIAQSDIGTEQQGLNPEAVKTVNTNSRLSESVRAQHWGLSDEDWQRYQTLMQGIRGSVSPSTLSPLEVLGIHARNAGERRSYAEQWALMMREDAERILAFQHAYDEAQQRLFPQTQLIDAVKLAMYQAQKKLASERVLDSVDRLLFFTTMDCIACDVILDRLLDKLSIIDGIDIYLLDVASGNEEGIRKWAGSRKIDPAWVHQRRVTLNVDAGALSKLAQNLDQPLDQRPAVLRRRGDVVSPLSSAQF